MPDINATAPSTAGEPHTDTQPAKPLPTSSATLPAALQGRWGLTRRGLHAGPKRCRKAC